MLNNNDNNMPTIPATSESTMNGIFINYVKWIESISWLKFVLFIIFISIGKNMIENMLGIENNDFFNNVVGLCIFFSFGLKIFSNGKINKDNNEVMK